MKTQRGRRIIWFPSYRKISYIIKKNVSCQISASDVRVNRTPNSGKKWGNRIYRETVRHHLDNTMSLGTVTEGKENSLISDH